MKSSWVFQSGCGEIWIEGLVKFNATALQTTQVGGFVIGNTLSPTTPEDPNPFKCNHADCRETSFSFGQLIGIQELGPGAKPQRAFGEFPPRLMQKFRASPAKLHQTLFATLLLHRRHTCSTEQIQGAGPIGALRAEQSCQTWCQDGAGARRSATQPTPSPAIAAAGQWRSLPSELQLGQYSPAFVESSVRSGNYAGRRTLARSSL